ncbi:MAG: hypothetical protein GY765_19310, partial [bacterium]|nr:hypothetical protein [bacterium]
MILFLLIPITVALCSAGLWAGPQSAGVHKVAVKMENAERTPAFTPGQGTVTDGELCTDELLDLRWMIQPKLIGLLVTNKSAAAIVIYRSNITFFCEKGRKYEMMMNIIRQNPDFKKKEYRSIVNPIKIPPGGS